MGRRGYRPDFCLCEGGGGEKGGGGGVGLLELQREMAAVTAAVLSLWWTKRGETSRLLR